MIKKVILFFGSLFLIQLSAVGQETDPAITMRALLQKAQMEMQKNEYEEANQTFRKILSIRTKIPAEVSYLFAETLYMVGQYKNSENFVQKYLDISGVSGEYYLKAKELQKLLTEKMSVTKTCGLCDSNGYIKKTCETCHGKGVQERDCSYCRGKGHIMCQLCAGEGVRITRTVFGDRNYESCSRCSAKGYHDCPVCEGAKIVESYCETCLGLTYVSTGKVCKHEGEESQE